MKNDEKIKQLLQVIDEQEKELGEKPKYTYSTNGIFKFYDVSGRFVNLNTIHKINDLVNIVMTLISNSSNIKEACKLLEVDFDLMKDVWDGYTIEEWIGDCKKRIQTIKWMEKKKKLDASQKRLKQLISDEGKTQMEIDEIANSLKLD